MLKLMKLEMKKYKMKGYVKAVAITTLVLLCLMIFLCVLSKEEAELSFLSFIEVIDMVDSLVRAVYVIFAGTLLAKYIIDEYKNKTITILFMYPISRKKIMLAKLLLVGITIFFTMLLSNLILSSILYIFATFTGIITNSINIHELLSKVINVIITDLGLTGMSLISLYFGMRGKSVRATIVTSIILVSIVGSNWGEAFSLVTIIYIPIILGIIGIAIAYMAIRNVDNVDV